MLAAILALLKSPKVIGAAAILALVAAVGIYVMVLRHQVASLSAANATLEMQRDEAVRIGNRNAEEAKRQAAEFERKEAAARAERDAERRRAVSLSQTLEEIARAPKEDDGVVAPVLRRALERLSQPDPAPDRAKGRAGQAAGGAADVPAGAADPGRRAPAKRGRRGFRPRRRRRPRLPLEGRPA